MPDILGKNGSYANIHAGMKYNDDGSITMFATINDEILFQCQYVAFFRSPENIQEMRKNFRQAVQEKVDSIGDIIKGVDNLPTNKFHKKVRIEYDFYPDE
tara:strand:- start:36 stop:335 length:300 start_codon:yes stop_codon:yes gene_type:complete